MVAFIKKQHNYVGIFRVTVIKRDTNGNPKRVAALECRKLLRVGRQQLLRTFRRSLSLHQKFAQTVWSHFRQSRYHFWCGVENIYLRSTAVDSNEWQCALN